MAKIRWLYLLPKHKYKKAKKWLSKHADQVLSDYPGLTCVDSPRVYLMFGVAGDILTQLYSTELDALVGQPYGNCASQLDLLNSFIRSRPITAFVYSSDLDPELHLRVYWEYEEGDPAYFN